MHYLQSFLTTLIASDISALRMLGILKSAGFWVDEGKLNRREGEGVSASALRRELKKRAALCAKLFEDHKRVLMELSAVGEIINVNPRSADHTLIRHDDGTVECRMLGLKVHHVDDNYISTNLPSTISIDAASIVDSLRQKWDRERKQTRLYHAKILERFLDQAIKVGDSSAFYIRVEAAREFIAHERKVAVKEKEEV